MVFSTPPHKPELFCRLTPHSLWSAVHTAHLNRDIGVTLLSAMVRKLGFQLALINSKFLFINILWLNKERIESGKATLASEHNPSINTSQTAHARLPLAIPKSLPACLALECCRVSEYWKLAFPLGNASWKVSAGLQRVARWLVSALYNRILFNCVAF